VKKTLNFKTKSIIFSLINIILFTSLTAYSAISDKKYFKKIKYQYKIKKYKSLKKYSIEFFKKYPKSRFIPDVRLLLADIETDPQRAVKKYRVLVEKYKYFAKRDYAQYRICQILYLSSKWHKLLKESEIGIKKFPKSSYIDEYRILLILAYIYTEQYSMAKKKCLELIDQNHRKNILSRALVLLLYINKRTSGYSKKYIYNLRDLALGFGNSDRSQTIIFLLGEFYENKMDYNKAYSAYIDVITKFPESPEAKLAKKRIKYTLKHNPKRVLYFPNKKIIKDTEIIDIKPEIELDDNEIDDNKHYSISIGPFKSILRAKKIRKLLNEFKHNRIVRTKSGYIIYIGKMNDSETSLKIKIRLAEEFGINGKIVRILGDSKRTYIYGE